MSLVQESVDLLSVAIQLGRTKTQTTSREVVLDKPNSTRCKSDGILILFIRVYKDLSDVHDRFENWMKSFINTLDTDVMPGSQDFSSAYLPQ